MSGAIATFLCLSLVPRPTLADVRTGQIMGTAEPEMVGMIRPSQSMIIARRDIG